MGWRAARLAALQDDPSPRPVTGWLVEEAPEASFYNALCDHEWHRPAGEISACGGDMMVRSRAYSDAGGFDAQVIAAEDDEFCQRLRKAGWRMIRLPQEMTCHDAGMTRFGQWWRRAVRSGHGFAQVGAVHSGYFARERRRVWLYGLALPLLAVAGLVWGPLLMVVLAAYVADWHAAALRLVRAGAARLCRRCAGGGTREHR